MRGHSRSKNGVASARLGPAFPFKKIKPAQKDGDPVIWAFTPVFDGLGPAMTSLVSIKNETTLGARHEIGLYAVLLAGVGHLAVIADADLHRAREVDIERSLQCKRVPGDRHAATVKMLPPAKALLESGVTSP